LVNSQNYKLKNFITALSIAFINIEAYSSIAKKNEELEIMQILKSLIFSGIIAYS